MRGPARSRIACLLVAACCAGSLALVHAAGQTNTAGVDGVRRTPDGKPDFSGIWQAMNSAAWNIQDHVAEKGVPAGRGIVEGNEIPYRPDALIKKQENYKNRATADPETKCWMPGVPRIMYMPYPFQIAQGPKQISMLFEYTHVVRNIFMEGEHYPGHIDMWMGDSRGRWEGDTLVVDVTHFNDHTWFDGAGNFHSDALHVVVADVRYLGIGEADAACFEPELGHVLLLAVVEAVRAAQRGNALQNVVARLRTRGRG